MREFCLIPHGLDEFGVVKEGPEALYDLPIAVSVSQNAVYRAKLEGKKGVGGTLERRRAYRRADNLPQLLHGGGAHADASSPISGKLCRAKIGSG